MNTKKLKQLVLDLAIHGKLVPQDPNDEPASELLKRIQEEKAKTAKGKKTSISSDNLDEVPFEVPSGWVWCHSGDIAYIASGSTPSKESFVEDGIPYLKMYNLRNQKIDFNFHPQYIKPEIHNGKLARSRTKVGDIIMNIVGPPLGKLAIIPESLSEANFNQAAVLIRPLLEKDTIANYIFYYLSEMSEIKSITTKGTAGQENISLTQSQHLRIPLPPLSEQKRIVSAIEKWFVVIDQIESNEADLRKSIEQTKKKVLDLAIHGKLVEQDENDEPASELLKRIKEEKAKTAKGKKAIADVEIDEVPFELPKGWIWCLLPDLCSIPITDGTHQTPTYSDKENGIPFLSSKDVTSRRINWTNIKYITKGLHEELYKRIAPQKDDILLAKNGTTGVAAIVEDDRVFDIYVTLAVIRPISKIVFPLYLLHVINSGFCKEQFNSHLTGIGLPNLHLTDIKKTIIPLPPLAEQKRIVAKVEKVMGELDKMVEMMG